MCGFLKKKKKRKQGYCSLNNLELVPNLRRGNIIQHGSISFLAFLKDSESSYRMLKNKQTNKNSLMKSSFIIKHQQNVDESNFSCQESLLLFLYHFPKSGDSIW